MTLGNEEKFSFISSLTHTDVFIIIPRLRAAGTGGFQQGLYACQIAEPERMIRRQLECHLVSKAQ